MSSRIPHHIDHKVRGTVDHRRLVTKIGAAGDKAPQFHAANQIGQTAPKIRFDLGEQIDRTYFGGFLAFLKGKGGDVRPRGAADNPLDQGFRGYGDLT
ncbi:hypothetical protein PB2503_02407 [Parvularcula bermudensis HTCC2503]|uniref:Uncharacterized protein n=1 Tax=Parvularcula bermudensis (strain ATCC BAA-594 / HTCC2503 / KCTC 12087) TaxID=314260 RepID=E0TCC6_PARBH|nr:hypothetical protein PB2503_02407 [Parvularcula bermudensis HTCC2503]